jgi:tetrahydromethanopterin S-methyltransferase subunit B
MLGFSPCAFVFSNLQFRSGSYETAGVVKVFVFAFAFVFSLVAFLFLLLFLLLFLPLLVSWIHLGLLYALAGSRCGLGA